MYWSVRTLSQSSDVCKNVKNQWCLLQLNKNSKRNTTTCVFSLCRYCRTLSRLSWGKHTNRLCQSSGIERLNKTTNEKRSKWSITAMDMISFRFCSTAFANSSREKIWHLFFHLARVIYSLGTIFSFRVSSIRSNHFSLLLQRLFPMWSPSSKLSGTLRHISTCAKLRSLRISKQSWHKYSHLHLKTMHYIQF